MGVELPERLLPDFEALERLLVAPLEFPPLLALLALEPEELPLLAEDFEAPLRVAEDPPLDELLLAPLRDDACPPFLATALFVLALAEAKPRLELPFDAVERPLERLANVRLIGGHP